MVPERLERLVRERPELGRLEPVKKALVLEKRQVPEKRELARTSSQVSLFCSLNMIKAYI